MGQWRSHSNGQAIQCSDDKCAFEFRTFPASVAEKLMSCAAGVQALVASSARRYSFVQFEQASQRYRAAPVQAWKLQNLLCRCHHLQASSGPL